MSMNIIELKRIEDDVLKELPIILKSEEDLRKDLNKIFDEIEEEYFVLLLLGFKLPRFNVYENKMAEILKKNYLKIGNKFKNTLRKRFNIRGVSDVNIDFALNKFATEESKEISNLIIKTTNKVSINEIEKIEKELIATEMLVNDKEKAKLASENFKQRNNNRINSIAETETGKMAERSKLTEAETLAQANIIKTEKVWSAILDKATRPHHAAVDGQVKPLNEPFVVNGELLKVPRDRSLGASASNIINCRCSVQYRVVK